MVALLSVITSLAFNIGGNACTGHGDRFLDSIKMTKMQELVRECGRIPKVVCSSQSEGYWRFPDALPRTYGWKCTLSPNSGFDQRIDRTSKDVWSSYVPIRTSWSATSTGSGIFGGTNIVFLATFFEPMSSPSAISMWEEPFLEGVHLLHKITLLVFAQWCLNI